MDRRLFLAGTVGVLAAPTAQADEAGVQLRRWPAGQATPALSLPSQDGPRWDLSSARGKVVVLNFWASWCEPCRTEMPSLELLAQRHDAEGLLVLAVNFRETDAAVQRFLQTMPITLPILRDRDGAAARAFQVRVFPTTVLVGRDGRVVLSVVGEADWTGARAREWIAPLLTRSV